MRVFLDSSALVKRYIGEPGSEKVVAWCDKATELVVTVIAVPEVISSFCRLVREGRLTEQQYAALKGDLRADLADAILCDTSPQVVQRAIFALEKHSLRAMDAIQLGAALVTRAEVFVSADRRQCEAAKQLGVDVVAV